MNKLDVLDEATQKAIADPWEREDETPRWRERALNGVHNGTEMYYIAEADPQTVRALIEGCHALARLLKQIDLDAYSAGVLLGNAAIAHARAANERVEALPLPAAGSNAMEDVRG